MGIKRRQGKRRMQRKSTYFLWQFTEHKFPCCILHPLGNDITCTKEMTSTKQTHTEYFLRDNKVACNSRLNWWPLKKPALDRMENMLHSALMLASTAVAYHQYSSSSGTRKLWLGQSGPTLWDLCHNLYCKGEVLKNRTM